MSSCGLCFNKESKYACPRCNIQYCSLKCYRSPAHNLCSEEFYKESIQKELQSTQSSEISQKQTKDILERIHQLQIENEEEESSTDSDDDEDLNLRLEGVDLDNADEVWKRLTLQERKEFEKAIESGDMESFIPTFTPWWIKKRIVLVEEESQIPSITDDVPPLPPSKIVSPNLRYTVLNVLYAYVYAMKFVYGDYRDDSHLFGSIIVHISMGLKNEVYDNVDTALESAASRVDPLYSVSRDLTKTTKRDAILIARDFVLEGLSDLRTALLLPSTKSDAQLKKNLKQSIKKIEFLIAYAKTHWKSDFLT